MGLTTEAVAEIIGLLRERQEIESLEALLDKPFNPKLQLEKQRIVSRYSDGSIRVFYGALERETAEAEVKHHIRKYLTPQHATKPRTVYYLGFACDFVGNSKDLREKYSEWPWLTHDTDSSISKCHNIAREAVQEGLDGLLAPSARRNNGTCLPVFKRTAISNPESTEFVAFTFDPTTSQFI
ncbi:MAG: RES family NAD+ phosphorylase [Nitrospirota bacterium]